MVRRISVLSGLLLIFMATSTAHAQPLRWVSQSFENSSAGVPAFVNTCAPKDSSGIAGMVLMNAGDHGTDFTVVVWCRPDKSNVRWTMTTRGTSEGVMADIIGDSLALGDALVGVIRGTNGNTVLLLKPQ